MTSRPDEPRSFQQNDGAQARALANDVLGASPYIGRAMEIIDALESADPECRGLVIGGGRKSLEALAIFGPVAGATDVWRLQLLLLAREGEPRKIGPVVVEAVVDRARREGARLLTAELPADAMLGDTLTAMRASAFRQEARVPDFFGEGVALLFLRREL